MQRADGEQCTHCVWIQPGSPAPAPRLQSDTGGARTRREGREERGEECLQVRNSSCGGGGAVKCSMEKQVLVLVLVLVNNPN